MSIKAILFDLDGTLLPISQEVFTKHYFTALAGKLQTVGYEPQKFLKTLNFGVRAMLYNNGTVSNEEVFWHIFTSEYGKVSRQSEKIFEEFYENEFRKLKIYSKENPDSRKVLDLCHKKKFKTVLATNPVFPEVAVKERLSWNGMALSDFEFVTTYTNSRFCKPEQGYYLDIAEMLGVEPRECLMVGNDVSDDMPAKDTGMSVFLLTDCLLNAEPKDLERYPSGGFAELIKFIDELN